MHMPRTSMSWGWSPTGTRAIPGKSTSVMVSTYGLQIFSRICFSEMPLLKPVSRSVSAWISDLQYSVCGAWSAHRPHHWHGAFTRARTG